MGGDRLASSNRIDALVRLALHADPAGIDADGGGDARLYRFAVRSNLRALEDDDDVDVLDREAAGTNEGDTSVSSTVLDAPFQRGSVSG